jgi:hypothetical protein
LTLTVVGLAAILRACANDGRVNNAVARTTANDNEAVLREFIAQSYSERLTTVKLMPTRRTDYALEELTGRANEMVLILIS